MGKQLELRLVELREQHCQRVQSPPRLTGPFAVIKCLRGCRVGVQESKRILRARCRQAIQTVLFRVLYSAGLRISEALNLRLPDVDTSAGTLRIRDSKNGQGRTIPITGRVAATLQAYAAAAHPAPEGSDYLFYSRDAGRPINQATYLRFRGYLADAGIPHFTGGPHTHSLRPRLRCRQSKALGRRRHGAWPRCCPTWPVAWATPTFAAPSTTSG